MSKPDPLKPSTQLLAKIGSIAQHCDEAFSAGWHEYDFVAIKSLLADPEVAQWLDAMDKMAFLPKKR